MDSRREILGEIGIQHATCRIDPVPRSQTYMEDLGSVKDQNLLMAGISAQALDRRPKIEAWLGGTGGMLPLRPSARNDRPLAGGNAHSQERFGTTL